MHWKKSKKNKGFEIIRKYERREKEKLVSASVFANFDRQPQRGNGIIIMVPSI